MSTCNRQRRRYKEDSDWGLTLQTLGTDQINYIGITAMQHMVINGLALCGSLKVALNFTYFTSTSRNEHTISFTTPPLRPRSPSSLDICILRVMLIP